MREPRLSGQVAVITGAASGIGAATAARLAAEGAAAVLVDLADDVRAVAATITDGGGRALAVSGDVSDEELWPRLARITHDAFGPVTLLVSNAATVQRSAAHETTLAAWDRQLAVNLTASFLGVRALVADLAATGGSIVLMSSVHAAFGLPGRPAYAASKGGLTALARQLAVEYGPAVRVNAVLPGPILTAAWAGIGAADREASAAETALGRLGSPEEVAAAVAFLGSPDASYITGACLYVDGGWSVLKRSS